MAVPEIAVLLFRQTYFVYHSSERKSRFHPKECCEQFDAFTICIKISPVYTLYTSSTNQRLNMKTSCAIIQSLRNTTNGTRKARKQPTTNETQWLACSNFDRRGGAGWVFGLSQSGDGLRSGGSSAVLRTTKEKQRCLFGIRLPFGPTVA